MALVHSIVMLADPGVKSVSSYTPGRWEIAFRDKREDAIKLAEVYNAHRSACIVPFVEYAVESVDEESPDRAPLYNYVRMTDPKPESETP